MDKYFASHFRMAAQKMAFHINSSSAKGLCIAFTYGFVSASMAFLNKAVLSTYKFDFPILLVTCQMIFTIIVMEALRIFKVISLQQFTLEKGKTFMLPSLFYALNSVLALWALSGMNIPMYGVIKRCSPLLILLLGPVMSGKGKASMLVSTSVLMMTCGCFVAGYGDLAFDLECYVMGFASVISQSLYLVLVQMSSHTLTAMETLYLNSYNTFPLLFAASVIFGEYNDGLSSFQYTNIGFVIVFSLVICMGTLLNYLLFLCTVYNSALTTSITGTLKSIIQTSIGVFTFGGISINVFTMSGILLNLSGGVLYSFAKYSESRGKALAKTKSAIVLSNMEQGSIKDSVSNGISGTH